MTRDEPGRSETVYVVDDDEAARDSLCLLLKVNGLCARGFGSAEALLVDAEPDDRACIVADLHLPGADGTELIRELRARGSTAPVIVVTGSSSVRRAVAALKAGAADVVEKPFEACGLLRSIFRALDGRDAPQAGSAAAPDARRRLARLTSREAQVLELVAAGDGNAAVARRLGLSLRTVEVYRAGVMAKLDATSAADLARIWRQANASS